MLKGKIKSCLRVNLRAFFHELFRLGFHSFLQRLFLGEAEPLRGVASVRFQVSSGFCFYPPAWVGKLSP